MASDGAQLTLDEAQALLDEFSARLRARSTNPSTSKAAARRVVGSTLARQKEEAYTLLRQHGPGTCLEIAERAAPGDPLRQQALYRMLGRRFIDLKRENPPRACHQTDEACWTVVRDGRRVWEAL